MKTSILLFFTITLSALANSSLQIIAIKDKNGESYIIRTWNGPDEGMVDTKYTIAEAQAKFPTLIGKDESGTVKDPKRITIIYNPDGTIYKVDFQATGDFERVVKTEDELTATALDEMIATKEDIETKTGASIDGKPK